MSNDGARFGWNRNACTKVTTLCMGDVGEEDGRELSICTRKMGPGMGDVMAMAQSWPIVCMKGSERRMVGNEAFVLCGRRKVYRPSGKTL